MEGAMERTMEEAMEGAMEGAMKGAMEETMEGAMEEVMEGAMEGAMTDRTAWRELADKKVRFDTENYTRSGKLIETSKQ